DLDFRSNRPQQPDTITQRTDNLLLRPFIGNRRGFNDLWRAFAGGPAFFYGILFEHDRGGLQRIHPAARERYVEEVSGLCRGALIGLRSARLPLHALAM